MTAFSEAFSAYITEKGYRLTSFATSVGDGEPEYIRLTETNRAQDIYSVAKAFTVTAIGFLWDAGLLSTDEKLGDILLPECPDMHPAYAEATVEMALTHKLGLPERSLDIDLYDPSAFGRDFLAYALKDEPVCAPGERYCYTDAAYYILSRVVEARSGMKLDDFLWEKLFYPLGFTEAAWSKCPLGHPMGATGLYITSADMTKLGSLYLNRGVYHGVRLFSEEWVERVLSHKYELRPTGVGESYAKGGMYGQMLVVFPDKRRVVAWQGFRFKDKADLFEFIEAYKD